MPWGLDQLQAIQLPSTLDLWEAEKLDPTSRQIMDADSTTVLVGREGCRYRVRIERVE
jgi:hypothetical protein